MSNVNTEKLDDILRRLNEGEDSAEIRAEIRELLDTLSAKDLSEAEQRLIDSGLDPEKLRSLCTVHMEMMGEKLEDLKEKLPPGHVVHTLMREHDYILEFLDELETINARVQHMAEFDPDSPEWKRLRHIAHHLVEAEPHHEREEEVLFPRLEALGVTGPPRIMRMEHADLRHHKQELKVLADRTKEKEIKFAEFKKELNRVSNFLVFHLRDHIFKENHILYPTAVEMIHDKAVWEELHREADSIGYCCFTPED